MKLIVGLGNPGEEHISTRHNIGFLALEEFARNHSIRFKINKRFNALTAEARVDSGNIYLAKPHVLMNLSGHSVRHIVKWLKIDLKDMLVILDDVSLPFGAIRLRPRGSSGGHNGLRSIIDSISSQEFSRMRIGIMGKRNIKDLSEYVLHDFTRTEKKKIPRILNIASQACECWIKEGVEVAMNRYNSNIKNQISK